MPRLIIILLLLLSGSGLAPAQEKVRLVTWNVRNLFDAVDSPYADEVLKPAELEKKLKALAHTIKLVKPDILALQEVENLEVLQALQKRLPEYEHAVLVEGNDHHRGIDVAMLSRIPILKVRSHAKLTLPHVAGAPADYHFSRDCLEVWFNHPLPLVVLVNHFRSQRGPGRKTEAKRKAQALAVVNLVEALEKEHPGLGVAVVGDLNDSLDSWALQPLSARLSPALVGLPLKKRYTHRYRGRDLVYDHILVNGVLKDRLVPKSGKVWHEMPRRTSDHYPVSVELR